MRVIDRVAEHPHYSDHIEPIWNALPDRYKGRDWADTRCPYSDHLLLVAGYSEIVRHPRNHVVYAEHGAGQSYEGIARGVSPFYSGGSGHQFTDLFICPNADVAGRWLQRYESKRAIVVGSPRLDNWHIKSDLVEPRTVAITFHWDAQQTGVPETTSAFSYYLPHLLDLVSRWTREGWKILGHNHPKYPAVAEFWRSPEMRIAGVEYVASAAEILDRAAILVADNTTLQADFLSLGRPVVWLNHPGYRREISHGGRFWQWPQRSPWQQSIHSPADLARLDLSSLSRPRWHPYAFADGHAAERAAAAIVSLLEAT